MKLNRLLVMLGVENQEEADKYACAISQKELLVYSSLLAIRAHDHDHNEFKKLCDELEENKGKEGMLYVLEYTELISEFLNKFWKLNPSDVISEVVVRMCNELDLKDSIELLKELF